MMPVKQAILCAFTRHGSSLAWGQMESAVRGMYPTLPEKPSDAAIIRGVASLEADGLIVVDRSGGRSRFLWKLILLVKEQKP
jgi:hypothetical protein